MSNLILLLLLLLALRQVIKEESNLNENIRLSIEQAVNKDSKRAFKKNAQDIINDIKDSEAIDTNFEYHVKNYFNSFYF